MIEMSTEQWRPSQIVLVLQGGGALGAYQAGVYQGLHEAGIEPDWIIGTSIGGINGAILAGNSPGDRLIKLREFWSRIGRPSLIDESWISAVGGGFGSAFANLNTIMRGIPGFFEPNPRAVWGVHAPLGADAAAFYTTEQLKRTIAELVDFSTLNSRHPRLTVGAVNVRSGDMKYFDGREMALDVEHVMASGALPPAFPAVRIDGELYWDGGIYSNTPVEVVLDDMPRRDSLIFSVNVWQPRGREPETIWQVLGRYKDIQYSSRVKSHLARQEQIHRLRHIVQQLSARLPAEERGDPDVQEMASYGCRTTMHLVRLLSPRLEGEDHTKDIDFSQAGIRARWSAGYADIRRMLAAHPWDQKVDPLQGVVIHESTRLDTQGVSENKHDNHMADQMHPAIAAE
ncbi:MAG TPA: patatin-like phospholipase family protein [Stellaceae bacterium]|nr:patatin-like phospholipase family protein [Stellaceae bacterium]